MPQGKFKVSKPIQKKSVVSQKKLADKKFRRQGERVLEAQTENLQMPALFPLRDTT